MSGKSNEGIAPLPQVPNHELARRRKATRAKLHKVPEQGEALPVTPESVHELFEGFVNQGDLEGVAHLYEPNASFVERDGKVVSGSAAIKEYLRGLLSIKPRMRIHHLGTIDAGDIAVLLSEWELDGKAPDGSHISDRGNTYGLVRRGKDGAWRLVVDNPWRTMSPGV